MSVAQTAQSSAGDVSAGFINNAGLVVGGSGRLDAKTGQETPGGSGINPQMLLIAGGVAVVGLVLWSILRK